MQRKSYKTAGKMALIDYLSQNPDRQFTVDELCHAVNGNSNAGKSSVYRHLSALCDDETVRKFQSDARKCAVYQYVGSRCDCGSHFHEKCTQCGKLRHLDCDDSEQFAAHLLAVHGFAIDRGRSILYGLCAACRQAREG